MVFLKYFFKKVDFEKIQQNEKFSGGKELQSKLFIRSLVITEHSIYDINLLGTDLFPLNSLFITEYSLENKFIITEFYHVSDNFSDFIWDFGKLPFPTHLGKYFIKIGKIRAKIHEIGKIKAIFGLGMTPIYGLKNGQIKSLNFVIRTRSFA